jgi:hypothetical protein
MLIRTICAGVAVCGAIGAAALAQIAPVNDEPNPSGFAEAGGAALRRKDQYKHRDGRRIAEAPTPQCSWCNCDHRGEEQIEICGLG